MGAGAQKSGWAVALPAPPPPRSLQRADCNYRKQPVSIRFVLKWERKGKYNVIVCERLEHVASMGLLD